MFVFTLDIGAFPNPTALARDATLGIAEEIARPVLAGIRAKLLRAGSLVPKDRIADFNAYVQSIGLHHEEDMWRLGGARAMEQTGLDLEYGMNNMPYIPHIRTAAAHLQSRIDMVANRRIVTLARNLAKGVTMTRKVIR